MKSIGVRELRQRASEYLKQIEGGATLQVTANGRPVALLVPVRRRRHGRRQLLADQGRLVAGAGDLLELGPPLPAARGVSLPSEALARARDDER